jgi:hypothetical protein
MSEHEVIYQCAHCGTKGWGFALRDDWVLLPDGWLMQEEMDVHVCSIQCARDVDLRDPEDASFRSIADDQIPSRHFSEEQLRVFRERFGWDRARRCEQAPLRPGHQVRLWPSGRRDAGEPEVGVVAQREAQLWVEISRAADRPRRSILVTPALVLDRKAEDGVWTSIQQEAKQW